MTDKLPEWDDATIAMLRSIWRPHMSYDELERQTGMKTDACFRTRLERHVRSHWREVNGGAILHSWTRHEIEKVKAMRLDGFTCREIASAVGRTECAVSQIARARGIAKGRRRPSTTMRKNMKLSPNFTVAELTRTTTGLANSPNPEQAHALERLCQEILEPIRERWGGHAIRVNSGFRSADVNKKVRGSATSDHMKGCAADIEIPSAYIGDAFREIHQLWTDGGLPLLKQAIRYGDPEHPSFIHVSIALPPEAPRGQFLWTTSGGGAGGPYYTYRPGGA